MADTKHDLLTKINLAIKDATKDLGGYHELSEQQAINWCVSTAVNRCNFRMRGKVQRAKYNKILRLLAEKGIDPNKL